MCGIAGVLGLGRPLGCEEVETTEAMLRTLRHRGPDGSAVLADERCVLGNSRLRILDLSPAADLPMSGAGGGVRLAYNGEITNFLELRRELEGRHRFHSTTDSEVLLRLYEELGLSCLDRLTGMFAFCLYDRRRGKAYLVRDLYGIRPLFYRERGGKLYFASEIKALLETPSLSRELDAGAIWNFFSLAYIPGADTPFREIRELRGGHLLEADLQTGRLSEREYYRLSYRPGPPLSEEEAAARLRELMRDSVRRNLIADAPVGMTLSGGVDTSSILALARELGRSRDLHAFSIKMGEPSFDESRHQKIVVDAIPCRHHEITVGPREVLDQLQASVAYMDEPSGDGAAIPLFILAREARKHVSVLLFGEGGDEIFNAYETHRAYRARAAYRRWTPAWLRGALRAAAPHLPASYSKLSLDFRIKRFVEGAELGCPEAHFFWRHAFSEAEKGRLMPGRAGLPPTSDLFSSLFHELDFPEELDRLSLLDLRYYFIDDLMVKNDRMAMASSIEGRFPYMDRPLVEFAASLPAAMRLKGFQGRYLQKRAMAGLLPKPILRRQNMGLEMPHSLWFLKDFRETAERYFSAENVRSTGVLDPQAVAFFWNQHLCGKKDYGRPLWCVLNFLVWFDLYVRNGDYKKHWT